MEKIAEKNHSSSCCWLPIMTARVVPTQHNTKNAAASSSLSLSSASSSSACTTQSVQKSLIAGYIAGTIGVIIGYPLDSFKVWIQTNTHKNNYVNNPFQTTNVPAAVGGATASPLHHHQQQQQQTGMLTIRSSPRTGTQAASSLATATTSVPRIKASSTLLLAVVTTTSSSTTTLSSSSTSSRRFQGMLQWTRALYRGVAGPLVTVGLVQGLNFAIYDSTRRALYAASHRPNNSNNNNNNMDYYLQDDSSLLHVGVASVTAGAVLAFITSPLIMIKTKQQVQQISFAQAARQMVQRRGCGGGGGVMMMTRGFGPHFVSETVGRGIYFCVYEKCKQSWMKHDSSSTRTTSTTTAMQQQPQTSSISLTGRMASAGVAGMACWTILFPLDVLRNRLFATTEQQYLSAWTMAKRIYQEGGVRGFYRGYGISIFRAGPVAALVLPIYDMTLEHLNK